MKGTFIALEMKSFGPKKSNYIQGLKSAIWAIFQKGLGWPCPVKGQLISKANFLVLI
jgi:hypothetical protein